MFLSGLIISCSATGYIFLRILDELYERKYRNNKYLYVIILLFHVFFNIMVGLLENPMANLLYSFISFNLYASLLYKEEKKTILLNSVLIIAYLSIIDLIVTTMFSIIVCRSTVATLHNSLFYMVTGIANVMTMLCTYRLFCERVKRSKIEQITKYLYGYMMFLLIFEMAILVYFLWRMENAINNISLLLFGVGFIIVDIGILYLVERICENFELKQKTELLEQEKYLIWKHYDGVRVQYEKIEKILHDVKKHLQVAMRLNLKHENFQKQYVDDWFKTMNIGQQEFYCSDKIICAILWEKIEMCRRNAIEISIVMQDISFEFMDKIDVTSLFSNLFDNAIDACLKCKNGNAEICLRVHVFKNYVVIKMSNTVEEIPQEREGKLISTKKAHKGLGINILEDIANKYCGNFNYSCYDKIFEIKIILSINNRE